VAYETERKYLVDIDKFKKFIGSNNKNRNEKLINKTNIKQAYLNHSGEWLTTISKEGVLTFRSKINNLTFKHNMSEFDTKQLINHRTSESISKGNWQLCPIAWASRVRIYNKSKAEICLKERIAGNVRGECETESSLENATHIFNSVNESTHKTRYLITLNGYKWEVDLFHDLNEGLCVAELETDDKNYELLSFIIKEITKEKKYYNDELSKIPFTKWDTINNQSNTQ